MQTAQNESVNTSADGVLMSRRKNDSRNRGCNSKRLLLFDKRFVCSMLKSANHPNKQLDFCAGGNSLGTPKQNKQQPCLKQNINPRDPVVPSQKVSNTSWHRQITVSPSSPYRVGSVRLKLPRASFFEVETSKESNGTPETF